MQNSHAEKFAFVFPGQGSQSVGMLKDYVSAYPVVNATFEQASSILGYDLWSLVQNGPEVDLNHTEITQPALLTAGVAIWKVWQLCGGQNPDFLAGHSLGEYTALVCSGVLRFEDAVTLVRDRGKYMQESVPSGAGAMAAIIGLDSARIEQLCLEAAIGGIVSAANYNSPEQTVIAGEVEAVTRANELCKAAGAKRALLLPVSVPSHCLLMKAAAERLELRLNDIAFNPPGIPVLQNIDAQARESADAIKAALVKQLHQPVRWVDTINRLGELQCRTIIETGPGKVLTGLIKRINKDINTVSITDINSLEQTVKQMQK